jgi:large subunit ribosomal protein L24|tara:strand:+ start:1381 stop:1701 length:321 start_codon:yes stop_codon:yes gene_type:complete
MKNKIKTPFKIGDKIKVITGQQKGLIGNISFINQKKETLSLDNLLPRITYKKNPQSGESKKVEIQPLIHISNVMLWDKDANKCSKIGYKVVEGQKKRYFKKSGNFV